ncbi:MAG: fibronectin type III domain-containing protein [Thermoplasmata archaeon]|nr:MAG: fibronectin type III domain-containing protein [Thermoplasmata archaeon]
MIKFTSTIIAMTLIVTGVVIITPKLTQQTTAYTPHGPISIDGDTDFATQASNEGWPGDGTAGNPYIIENYEINSTFIGIHIVNVNVHFKIRNCYFHECDPDAIAFRNTLNGVIENNLLVNNNEGMQIWQSGYITISNNSISQHSSVGIWVPDCSSVIIYNNSVNTSHWGIAVATSDLCTISYNKIYSNRQYGICLIGSANQNTIMYNYISNNTEYGIILEDSDINIVHHNDLIDNNGANDSYDPAHIQAYDNRSTNEWDDGYPSGGNYWSDYDGTDLNSSPTQDVPPPDGMGDTPYIIDGNSRDNYPLMEPVFQSTPSKPQNLQALTGNSFVNLTWEDPILDGGSSIIGYNIYKNDTTGVHAFVPYDQMWFNDTGLANGITYTYNISAVNINGEGANATISATPSTIPSAVVNLQVDEGYGYVNLSWNPPGSDGGSAIIEYRIYRNGTTGPYDIVSADQPWYNDTSVSEGVSYIYNVTAKNNNGEGSNSTIVGAPLVPTIPSTPLNPQTDSGNGYVNLTWEKPSSDGGSAITGYNIYRNGTTGVYVSVPIGNLWYNDTNVTNNVTYAYNVSAVNGVGEGPHTTDIPGTPFVPTIPTAPVNVQADIGNGYVNLTWDIPLNDGNSTITGYYIYRNGTIGPFSFVPASHRWYEDTDVTNEITYTYNVSAVNGIGEGPKSPNILATPLNLTVPSEPKNPYVDFGNGFVNLTWVIPDDDGNSPITIYNIYRHDISGIYETVSGDQLWFNDSNVINGITYSYQVSAVNSIDEGDKSTGIDATPRTTVSPPQNFQIEIHDDFLNFSWDVPLDDGGSPITGYNIYRNDTSEVYGSVAANQLWFIDDVVVPGINYTYYVSVINDVGEGPLSTGKKAKAGAAPSAPTDLAVTYGDLYVNLTWTAPEFEGGYPITNYVIYRGETKGEETYLIDIENILFYNDTTVLNGVTYYYSVSSKNHIGEGDSSETVNATPGKTKTLINQPPTCSISTPSSGSIVKGTIEITGLASDNDGTVQKVQISIDNDDWIEVEGTTSWSYNLDTTFLSNGEHTISVRAYDGTDYSPEAAISVQIENPSSDSTEKSMFEESWFWILIVLVIIFLVFLFLLTRMKRPIEEIEKEGPVPSEDGVMQEEESPPPEEEDLVSPVDEEDENTVYEEGS